MLNMKMGLGLSALAAALFSIHGMPGRVSLADAGDRARARRSDAFAGRRSMRFVDGKTYRARGRRYPEQSGRQELRAYRRAQGGPGIEFVAGAWAPRGANLRFPWQHMLTIPPAEREST